MRSPQTPIFDERGDVVRQAPAFVAAAPPRKEFPYKLELCAGLIVLLLVVSAVYSRMRPRTVVAMRPIEKGGVIAEEDVKLVAIPVEAAFTDLATVANHIAANDVVPGRPLRKDDVGPLAVKPSTRDALRDIAPYRILTKEDVANAPVRAVSLTAVRKGKPLADTDVVALASGLDTVTVVRLTAPPPHMKAGIPAMLYAKNAAQPVPAQFLKALDDDRYVIACRAADAGALAASRVAATQGVQ